MEREGQSWLFRVTKLATTIQVWPKVGRNFLMYVGEPIGCWLAFILQPDGLSRDVPISSLQLTFRNLVNESYRLRIFRSHFG